MAIEDYRGDVNMCCRCSACRYIPLQKIKGKQNSACCPSISKYNYHAYSGGGRLLIAKDMLNNGFQYTDQLLDIVYNCNLCGACDVSCKYGMDMEVLDPIQEFRMNCVENGHTHPALEKVMAGLRKQGTMVQGKPAARGEWAAGLNIKDYTKEKVDVIYHVGCKTSFDKDMWKVAKATASLLKKAGVNFGIGGANETCCGGRAYQMGYQADFLTQAKANMAKFKKAGVKTLVTGCADGYQAFKVLYDKFDLKGDLEVLHTTEYFDRLIKEGKLSPRKKVDLEVTYHDPCRLGRQGETFIHWQGKRIPGISFMFDPPKTYRRGTNGVYGPPRNILASIPGITLREMDRIKEYAWCCGAGGGVNESNPEFASWTAVERINEAVSSGAQALVSACPWCESLFAQSVKETGSSLKVFDVAELLEKSI
jgi:Fe-S oxidoreductase